ncbi:EVE domain-containing protein [Pseudaestuariivita rosea]|uniref:EVE domain-containing protein n=1 Tax=Pseudaestuariivita rosea TaxID=2763263 RepID=UPI001ABB205A|nr:EVE domain-containing protein [Pseudaestuariivita rosea]
MTKRYWIGLAEAAYVDTVKDQNVCLFSGGDKQAVEALSTGDRITYYSPNDSHGGDRLDQFTALAEVTGDDCYQKDDWPDHPKFEAWVRDCAYEDVGAVPLSDVADRLDCASSPDDFSTGQIEISEKDFNTIAQAMRDACSD